MTLQDHRHMIVVVCILLLIPGVLGLLLLRLRHIRFTVLAQEVKTFYDECQGEPWSLVVKKMSPERQAQIPEAMFTLLQDTDTKDKDDPERTRYVSNDVIDFMHMIFGSRWGEVQKRTHVE